MVQYKTYSVNVRGRTFAMDDDFFCSEIACVGVGSAADSEVQRGVGVGVTGDVRFSGQSSFPTFVWGMEGGWCGCLS